MKRLCQIFIIHQFVLSLDRSSSSEILSIDLLGTWWELLASFGLDINSFLDGLVSSLQVSSMFMKLDPDRETEAISKVLN